MSKRKFESGASKRKMIKDQDLLIKCANDKTQKKINIFLEKSTGKK